ncbi:MAG: hypothetical protein LW854_19805 [Rubrivivax sp.]|jgi:hypothetical protein|nr:hypothetical protein [Rubrivivax sp.]
MNWSALIPKTPKQWLVAVAVVLAIASVALSTNPGLIRGHTVAVSVENAGPNAVFAYLDNTGRHGENTETATLEMSGDRRTPPGLVIGVGKMRSFGLAVGLFDQPTLHVYAIAEGGKAVDTASLTDCVFEAWTLSDPKLPPWQVKVRWSASGCTVTR